MEVQIYTNPKHGVTLMACEAKGVLFSKENHKNCFNVASREGANNWLEFSIETDEASSRERSISHSNTHKLKASYW